MTTRQTFHELIYVSLLAPGTSVRVVATIAKTARVANKELDVTGVLVFDGERFCQYLEGAIKEVVSLFERISADTRHTDVQLVHQGGIEQRHFRAFSMGYANIFEDDVIGRISNETGTAARATFVGMTDKIDFGA